MKDYKTPECQRQRTKENARLINASINAPKIEIAGVEKLSRFVIVETRQTDLNLSDEKIQEREARKLFEFLIDNCPHGVFKHFADLIVRYLG